MNFTAKKLRGVTALGGLQKLQSLTHFIAASYSACSSHGMSDGKAANAVTIFLTEWQILSGLSP